MKNALLSLVLLAPPTFLYPNQQIILRTPITQEEKKILDTLYGNKKNAALFAQGLTTAELNYAIYLLSKKIQILQNNMLAQNSEKIKRAQMFLGSLATILYGGMSSLLTYNIYKKHDEFISGKFKNAFVSQSKVNNISSIRFSLKEKRYLKRFKAENIIIGAQSSFIFSGEKEKTQKIVSQLSRRNKEKLNYCALQETVAFHKRKFLRDAFMPAFLIIITTGIFTTTLYAIIFYKELLQDRLDDYKHVQQVLISEQENRRLS